MIYKYLIAGILLATTGCFFPSSANARPWWSGENRIGSYEVEIVVDGIPRPAYQYGGHSYSEGVFGERYVIRIHNRSWRRVEAVISVDGRDAIDGRPSNLEKRGYVIPPYSSIDVDGFRISMGEVAAFRFTTVPDSYAARMGTPWEVGVIGVAFFPERTPYPRPRPPYTISEREGSMGGAEDRAAKSAEAAPMGQSRDLGTQFGERRVSPVSETSFQRETWYYPQTRLSLRYNSRAGLCSMGLGAFCYPPYPPPRWPPPPYDPPPPPDRQFSQPPDGWDHFSPWY